MKDGWDELRREIEALPPYRDAMWGPFFGGVRRDAVLAIVDRLAAPTPDEFRRQLAQMEWTALPPEVIRLIDADLAAAGYVRQEPAIDVERLARAMADVSATPGAGWGNGNSWDDLTSVGKERRREQAAAVAAEYDRLGSE